MNCNICCEKYNQTTRKEICCNICHNSSCRKCIIRYILGEIDIDAHCMFCRKPWSLEFFRKNMTTSFFTKEWKHHIENILFQEEVSKLPETQQKYEQKMYRDNLRNYITHIQRLSDIMYHGMNNLKYIEHLNKFFEHSAFRYDGDRTILNMMITERDKIQEIEKLIREEYKKVSGNQEPEDRRAFIKPCPVNDCRGFLSTRWKCGMCQVQVCNNCGNPLVEDEEHECNPDDVATMEFIKKDTKPCPGCGAGIHKLSGCFAQDTPILLYDGTIKMSQNIRVGDVLIGDDGCPRIVQNLVSGEDKMYEIQQNNGLNYIVNSKHTLVVKVSGGNGTIRKYNNFWKLSWFDINIFKFKSKNFYITNECSSDKALQLLTNYKNSLNLKEEIEILIEDYLKLSPSRQKQLVGYKSANGIYYDEEPVSLDPYILGLWLGDGTHTEPIIASIDIEIKEYLIKWCLENDAELVDDDACKFRIRRKGYKFSKIDVLNSKNTFPEYCKRTNPFMDQIRYYQLFKNKHIPNEYMQNSREIRLKILAGLIDTDGCVTNHGKRVVITQVNKKLTFDIEYLARSLGFIVNVTKRERKNILCFNQRDRKDFADIYCINISGPLLHEIPTLIKRKKCLGTKSNKDYMKTSITVKYIGYDKYYGWSVDQNKRFLLKDFTVLRNCSLMWCTSCHFTFDWRTGKRATGHNHNPHYYEWQRQQMNGNAPRVPEENQCIDVQDYIHSIDHRDLRNLLRYRGDILMQLERYQPEDTEPLRIQYLLQNISEDDFKKRIQQIHKKNRKHQKYYEIFETYCTVSQDIFRRLIGRYNRENINEALREFDELRIYINECIENVKFIFNSKARFTLSDNYANRYWFDSIFR